MTEGTPFIVIKQFLFADVWRVAVSLPSLSLFVSDFDQIQSHNWFRQLDRKQNRDRPSGHTKMLGGTPFIVIKQFLFADVWRVAISLPLLPLFPFRF